jgi:uncharacterized membrane protein YsdA (DUF1294 family)
MFITRFLIHTKRLLKNPLYIIAVLLLPVLAACFVICYRVSPSVVAVALFPGGENAQSVATGLIDGDGSVEYVLCSDENEVRSLVASGDVQCGYIFGDRFEKAFENKDVDRLKKSITCVKSSSTVLDSVLDEFIMAAVSDTYCGVIAQSYADDIGINKDISNTYNEYVNGDEVFKAEITTLEGEKSTETANNSGQRIFMGLLAVYVLLGGVLGAMMAISDEKKGITKGNFECVLASAFVMSAVAEIVTVFVYGFDVKSLIIIFVYALAVAGYANVLRAMQSRSMLCGALPVLVFGAILFSGVVFDVGKLLPYIDIVGWLFPTGWYMTALKGDVVILVLLALMVNVFGFVVNKVRCMVGE